VGGAREASTGTLPRVIIAARIVSTPAGKTTGDALDVQPGKSPRPEQFQPSAGLPDAPSTAGAYRPYLEKFDRQETQIETLQAEIKKLQAAQHSQQKALDDFLAGLSAE
jgi:hypothetical protein